LGRVAWWRSDLALLAEMFPRVLELEAQGYRLARAIGAIGRAVIADLGGDDDAVLAHLGAIEPGVLDDAWEAVADWLRATTLAGSGRPDAAVAILDRIPSSPDPAFRLTVEGGRLAARWTQGHVDEVLAALPSLVDRIRAAGVLHNVVVGLAQATFVLASVGDIAGARRYLDTARQAESEAGTGHGARSALGEAAVLTALGDEPAAAAVLDRSIESRELDTGIDRRTWRNGLALTYVLVPSTRAHWDAADLHGLFALARRLAAAVVAVREGDGDPGATLAGLDVPAPSHVRAALHHRFAVELALGLEAAGRPEAGALLEALGRPGREAVRAVAADRTRLSRPATSLLAAVPTPPALITEVAVLGPLEVMRDGEPIADGDVRRERVRALLSFLVGHRATTRAAITAALWPDLDERAAANNLRVTMTYLLRLLEPWRGARESSYFIRADGRNVALVTGDWLRIDTDRFDDHRAVRPAPRPTARPRWRSST
jgi:hypothetical protein